MYDYYIDCLLLTHFGSLNKISSFLFTSGRVFEARSSIHLDPHALRIFSEFPFICPALLFSSWLGFPYSFCASVFETGIISLGSKGCSHFASMGGCVSMWLKCPSLLLTLTGPWKMFFSSEGHLPMPSAQPAPTCPALLGLLFRQQDTKSAGVNNCKMTK